MPTLDCNFFISKGLYRFESKAARDSFAKNPRLTFEFDSENLDDPGSAAEAFGVDCVEPITTSEDLIFDITFVEPDKADSHCCYVSAELKVSFEYHAALDSLKSWIEDHSSDMNFCGRICCEGEDGLDGSEDEGFVWPWDS